jgi:hypothetical protein
LRGHLHSEEHRRRDKLGQERKQNIRGTHRLRTKIEQQVRTPEESKDMSS